MGRNRYEPTHVQVPFVTRGGKHVHCDEGMYDILTLLKQMGVETHFSCQGDFFAAYICSFTEGMQPVIAKAVELYDRGWLSDQSMDLVEEWRDGYREIRSHIGQRVTHRYKRRYLKRRPQHFSHERETNGIYGDRTTIRWPKHRTREFHQLLLEVQAHI